MGDLHKNVFQGFSLYLATLFFILTIPGLSAPRAAFCDGGMMMKEPQVLWPAETDGWRIAEGPTTYNANTAFKYMNGAAELFLAYNMRGLTVLRYEKTGQQAITLEIFQMGSPEDAYGIFSFESDDPNAGIGQGSEFGGGLLRFWKGHYFVSVYGESPGTEVEAATLDLGRRIASSIKETGNPPKILCKLPAGETPFLRTQTWFLHSHILLNQRFFIAHKNILNLGPEVEAVLGRYGAGKEKIHLFLVKYAKDTEAQAALANFMSIYMPGRTGKKSVRTEHSKWTVADNVGRYIMIVFDAPREDLGMKLLRDTSARLVKEEQ